MHFRQWLTRFLLLQSVLLVVACSSFLSSNRTPIENVDLLIADQQFAEATKQIAKAQPEDPEYQQMIKKLTVIKQLSEQYVEETIKEIDELKKQLNWQQAKGKFTDALVRVPKELSAREKLQQQYQQMLNERDAYIARQRLRLNVKLGRYLLEEGEYLEKIQKANPASLSNSWELSSYKRRRKEIGKYLAEAGKNALESKKYYSARRYLKISQQLMPDEKSQAMLEKANEKIATFKQLKKQEQEENFQQLLNRYKMLRAAEDHSVAKSVLDTLLALKPDNKKLLAEQADLSSAIALTVNQAVLDGEARYSAGEVREALIIWKHAVSLAPDNVDLRQRIERAEKFLENYQSLQESGGG